MEVWLNFSVKKPGNPFLQQKQLAGHIKAITNYAYLLLIMHAILLLLSIGVSQQ